MARQKRKRLWKGLTAVLAFVLSFSLALGTILESYRSTIDSNLGTTSSTFTAESVDGEDLYTAYTPDEDYLNEDGTGNSEALIAAAIELSEQQEAEGAVLLKNDTSDGKGLPLEEGSDVTLLGIRSYVSLLGSGMGTTVYGPCITLAQALGGAADGTATTDFANTIATSVDLNWIMNDDGSWLTEVSGTSLTLSSWSGSEYEFTGAGLNINQTMLDVYETLNETYMHANNEVALEVYDPQEPSVSEYASVNADYEASLEEYDDAVIVTISRPSAENTDYLAGGVAEGTGASEPLELTDNEREVIELAKATSDNVIVLINSENAMEIDELADDDGISAILWIGFPGSYGMLGVADIISGAVSPSGSLADTYVAQNLSAPAMQNMGYYTYSNADELTRDNSVSYVIEAEDIYVGYRYYETRYEDTVLNVHNASSTAGTYASTDGWDYTEEVVYSFGYGLSYTTFTQEIVGEPTFDISVNDEGGTEAYATFDVLVTNTGDVAGKTSVQLYGQAPYIEGGVEKASIQLLGYGKTGELEPGESETVSVTVDLENIASYDEEYENEDGTTGTYIMDEGTYYFAVGNGAHDALNNVLAAKGYTTADGMDYDGDTSCVYVQEIDEDFISKTAFSVSKTGASVSNALDYSDWNYYQEGEVTYLSRADWEATWPQEYSDMTLTSEELISDLNGEYYTIQTGDDTSEVVWGEDNGIEFYQMAGVDYDDEAWDDLLDQMTLTEALYIATFGGPDVPGAESIGYYDTYVAENNGSGIVIALNATQDSEAPWAIDSSDANGNWIGQVLPGAPVLAATFNTDLQYDTGVFVGNESLFTGIAILWGPGLNIHRTAYNGRNGEYYSEDPVLAGTTCMEYAVGALQKGLIASPKHFAFNDQESNRDGVAPYMTEQRARELDLRAYQIAIEASKYDTEDEDVSMLGVMVSFSKIGGVECTASYGLMTTILQEEWGFKGYATTDIYDDCDIYGAVLASGTTCYDTRGISGFSGGTSLASSGLFGGQVDGSEITDTVIDGDATLQAAVKNSAHMVLYALSQSNLMNRYNSTTQITQLMTWWRGLYIGLIAVSGVACVASAVMYVRSGNDSAGKRFKKKGE